MEIFWTRSVKTTVKRFRTAQFWELGKTNILILVITFVYSELKDDFRLPNSEINCDVFVCKTSINSGIQARAITEK